LANFFFLKIHLLQMQKYVFITYPLKKISTAPYKTCMNNIMASPILNSTKTLPHYCLFLIKYVIDVATILIDHGNIIVHDVKFNIFILGNWSHAWDELLSLCAILKCFFKIITIIILSLRLIWIFMIYVILNTIIH
jgi:hypothetical protein